MLKKLRLQNFRTYLDAEIQFTQRHLLIGRNNSGKTNLYTALAFLRDAARGDLPSVAASIPGGIAEIKYASLDSNIIQLSCACELLFEGVEHEFSYQLKLAVESTATSPGSPAQQVLRVRHEELTVRWEGYPQAALLWSNGEEAAILKEDAFLRTRQSMERTKAAAPPDATMLSKLYDWQANPRAVFFRTYLSSWRFFTLNPAEIRRKWQERKIDIPILDTDGGNLSIVLYQIKNFDGRRYRNIMDHVRRLEPELEDVSFVPVTGQVPIPFVQFHVRGPGSWEGLSDGTLRFLALALLAESVSPLAPTPATTIAPFVVIEEPENGLYPGLLRDLLELFEERGALGQFVFTSHSPYFINLFDCHRQSVTLLRRSENGPTEVCAVPPPDESDPDRPMLADEYTLELLD